MEIKNQVVNLAIEQLQTEDIDDLLKNNLFFKEYIEVFNGKELFKDNIIKNIISADKGQIDYISDKLIEEFKKISKMFCKKGLENNIGLIIFIGDGSIDGHGIIIDNNPYVFIDLSASIPNISKYNLSTFMVHETIHALHYDLNKEVYPKNYLSVEDRYFKKLISEGIATEFSMSVFHISMESSYWLGLLEHEDVEKWIFNCEKMKLNVGKKLSKTIINDKFNYDIYCKLFTILKLKELTSYRMGYYYGSEIIKTIQQERSNIEMLTLDFDKVKKYIYEYFS
ncbi:hypothetical protein FDB54_06465 [Clostridium botulinum]|nr:hypothetical protein [Clostridium botulinum]